MSVRHCFLVYGQIPIVFLSQFVHVSRAGSWLAVYYRDMMDGWVERANVELRGAGLDESSDCYKRLPEVLAEHGQVVLGDFEYLNPDARDKPEFLAPSQQ